MLISTTAISISLTKCYNFNHAGNGKKRRKLFPGVDFKKGLTFEVELFGEGFVQILRDCIYPVEILYADRHLTNFLLAIRKVSMASSK